ncbi:MAG TPA: ATPase domain-containing protein [Thermoplasmata archaeon]|jgi:KaiC/GvpD/RAD55 family RecA-like ATPase|nr:ATPase domain-containing protein [Thermoplasmata archaeon]
MTKEDIAKELEGLRAEVRQLREAVATLSGARQETLPAGRVRTFVQGFDEALEGGIPTGHVVILAGPSGSMKTSIGLSTVYHNRQEGTKGVYVSLEEGRNSLLRTMERLGMKPENDDFIVDIARLRTEHEAVEGARDWLQILKDYLARRVEKDGIRIVVIDPLNSLYSLAELRNPRTDLFHFFTFLRALGVTALLIAEAEGPEAFPNHEEFVADGAIVLSYVTDAEGHVDLRIRCLKMRHTNHSRDYFRLEFEGGRFRVRPLTP